MAWKMLHETALLERIWMAFPLGSILSGEDDPEQTYRAWTDVAHAAAEFVPVTMVVDPSERENAARMLGGHITQIEAPLDDSWMRDIGPTFVVDDATGKLGGVDWIFNGWGAQHWAKWENDREIGRFVAGLSGAELVSSVLVNEGGAIHTDGEGTLLVTETVQLDPSRNPLVQKRDIEAEFARTLGVDKVIWLPRGLTRDYEDLGTRGHVDMIATFPSPGRLLLHRQDNPGHPDYQVMRDLRAFLSEQRDAKGRKFEIIDLPGPAVQKDDEGFVDYNYVNHLVANDGIVACGYGEPAADDRAADILAEEYGGKRVITVDARPVFAQGGGIHCITQQQPRVAGVTG